MEKSFDCAHPCSCVAVSLMVVVGLYLRLDSLLASLDIESKSCTRPTTSGQFTSSRVANMSTIV